MTKIMIADDDFAIGMEIEEMLTALGYDVVGQAGSGQEAVKMAQDLKPDIILMDIVMPKGMNGIDAAEKIKAESDIPIIFISGDEAVERAKTFDGRIDLALLDIKLPDMSGDQVYPLIMKARPDLKVIVFSGYAIDGPARKILNAGAEDFIQKPFSLTTLSEKLKETGE